MKLSIVTTIYNSASYLEEFYSRITKSAQAITQDYEIIFVDDGSPDDSLAIVYRFHLTNEKVKIIELSRNFGHHKAMVTGLEYAKGDWVFLIDSDLEEDPELLLTFWNSIHKNQETDVVYGVQRARKGHLIERWSGHLYYKIFNKMSDEIKIAENVCTVRIMKKCYVEALLQYQEHGYYFGPISRLAGFKQRAHYFTKHGKKLTSYNFIKKYHVFLDSIFMFSSKLLYFIFYFGILMTLVSFSAMAYLIVRKVFWDIALQGWTSLVILISLFGGMNMLFIGILSIYILNIFRETKNRPYSLVRNFYSQNKSPSKGDQLQNTYNLVTEEE